MGTKCQLGQKQRSGAGRWLWLYNSVTLLNATELYVSKWLNFVL